MRQTLFYIPECFWGVPVFGFGLVLALLAVVLLIAAVWRFRKVKKFDADIANYFGTFLVGGAIFVFVAPRVIEVGKGFPIRGYGFFLLIAIVSSLWLNLKVTKHSRITTDQIFSLWIWTVISGILGARIFYVTEYWREMIIFDKGVIDLPQTAFSFLNIANGGLVVFGAILGGIAGPLVIMHFKKLPILPTFDMMAPSVTLGIAIGRLGCLMNGCCFGGTCDAPWAITFPEGSPAHIHQIEHSETFFYGIKLKDEPSATGKTLTMIQEVQPNSGAEQAGVKNGMVLRSITPMLNGEPDHKEIRNAAEALKWIDGLRIDKNDNLCFNVFTDAAQQEKKSYDIPYTPSPVLPVHPTQIYSSLSMFFLTGLLLIFRRFAFFKKRDGMILCAFLILYSLIRFGLETIRTDEASFFGTGFTVSQNVSFAVFLAGLILMVIILKYRSTSCE